MMILTVKPKMIIVNVLVESENERKTESEYERENEYLSDEQMYEKQYEYFENGLNIDQEMNEITPMSENAEN